MKLQKKLLFLLLLTLFLSSCNKRLVSQKIKEQTKIEYRDSTLAVDIKVPKQELKTDGKIQGVKLIFAPGVPKQIVIEKETEKIRYKTVIDSTGYRTEVECKEDSVRTYVTVQNKKITILKETIKEYEKREGFFQKVIRYFSIGIALLVCLAIVLFILYRKIRKTIPLP